MAIENAEGDPVGGTTFDTNVGDATSTVETFTVDQRYTETFTQTGTDVQLRRLKFYEGQRITAAQKAAAFPDPTIVSITPATGAAAGGTAVTISGTALTGATAVTFGGTTATSIVVVNDTTITCATPAKTAGAYDVVVTTPNGTATEEDGFTYA